MENINSDDIDELSDFDNTMTSRKSLFSTVVKTSQHTTTFQKVKY